jgi:mannosyltransferase
MSTNQELLAKAGTVIVPVREFRRPQRRDVPTKAHRALPLALLGIVLSVYIALRVWHIGSYSLWYDEVFSVLVAKLRWSDLFRQVILDRIHPPLFYVVLKVWIAAVGSSAEKLRLLSVVFSVLTLAPLWSCMGQARLSKWVKLALLLAIACNPFLIFYSQEIRMYSLLCFLSVWSLDLCLKQQSERPFPYVLWLFVNVSLVMVHIAGVAVIGCEFAYVALTRKGFRKALLACLPALVAFSGWLIAVRVLSQEPGRVLHNVSWIPQLTLGLQWKTIAHLLGGAAGAVVLNVPIAMAIWTKRRVDRHFATLFLLLSVATIAFVFAFSAILRPIWQERYLIIAVIPYYLLAGDCTRRIRPKWALACTLAIAAAGLVSLEYDLTHRPDRPTFARFAIPAGEPIYASDDIVAAPLALREPGDAPVRVIRSVSSSNALGVRLTVRDVAYSIGQQDVIQPDRHVNETDFLYAYDRSSDAVLPAGLSPSSLASYGCFEKELVRTHGQGHEFVLYKINCI